MNAILIMCHKNPTQVLRLIDRCISPQTKVIVHVDKNSDSVFDKLAEEADKKGVYFTRERLHGVLDTRSLVDIAMLMIQRAQEIERDEKVHFDYYLLLSGQDYLTKSITEINANLCAAYPQPFIDCTPWAKSNWVFYKFRSNPSNDKYDAWVQKKFPKRGTLRRRTFRAIGLMAQKIDRVFHKDYYHSLKKQGIDLYGGSAWWILPDQAISFIVEEYNQRKPYVEELLRTWTPEETFFQIMTMRSPIAKMIQLNPIDMIAQSCKTWAFFSGEGKPFKGHPYIFTENEFPQLIEKDCWIARKFDETVDERVFDLLDDYITQNK